MVKMAIKQIQLRGISRNPSDRMTADGGCAESINVHLDEQETAPTLPAKNVTSEKLGSSSFNGYIFYIHKTANYEHYIGVDSNGSICAFVNRGQRQLCTLTGGASARITGASHIGNTLIVIASGIKYYFIFKDGSYTYLGNRIPEPFVEFETFRDAESPTSTRERTIDRPEDSSLIYDFDVQTWNQILSAERSGTELTEAQQERLSEIYDINSQLWALFESIRTGNRANDYFTLPTLGRFALRMYDGEYIYVSAPVFLGAGLNEILTASGFTRSVQYETGPGWASYVKVKTYPYSVRAVLKNWNIGNWGDYIESIDLFLSPYISNPNVNSKFRSLDLSHYFHFDDNEPWEEKILGASTFYKIASFDKNKISTLQSGINLLSYLDNNIEKQEFLVLQETLDADSERELTPIGIDRYNDRFLATGTTQVLPRGYTGFFAPMAGPSVTSNVSSFVIKYYVTGDDGLVHTVFGHSASGSQNIQRYSLNGYSASPFMVLFYPDPNCIGAEILYNTNQLVYLPMKTHPRLNCSYYIGNVGMRLDQMGATGQTWDGSESPAIEQSNKLYLTKLQNPFIMETGSTITFADTIVGTALTTKALSPGQIGQYPLLVFTEGGIYTVELSSVGDFLHYHFLAKDVALPGTILQLGQAVVFTTEGGVMLLQGSDITDLSANMHGRHYTHISDVTEALDGSDWEELLAATDANPFMAFMRTATPAFDYTGKRVIWFKGEYPYQFVYMLATNTWHKIKGDSYLSYSVLKSNPGCLVSCLDDQGRQHDLLDYSTVLKDSSVVSDTADPVTGLIATRPLDFGEPDVRKALRSIRIRGRFNRNDVQYLVLGSFDGINWKLLKSLRGGSYRMFRIIVLAKLAPTERISWIDVDYESRYNNKLR